jgi:hypothetical protein
MASDAQNIERWNALASADRGAVINLIAKLSRREPVAASRDAGDQSFEH